MNKGRTNRHKIKQETSPRNCFEEETIVIARRECFYNHLILKGFQRVLPGDWLAFGSEERDEPL